MSDVFDLLWDRGWGLYKRGKYEEAIARWREASRLDMENGYVLNNIGMALSKLGDQEAAITEWREAARLEPDYESPRVNLAYALSASGYSLEALAAVRAAIRLRPASVGLHNFLGYHLSAEATKDDKSKWKEAGEAFQKSVELEPSDSYAYRHLADIQWWYLGKKQEAIATLKAATAFVPDSIEAHLQLTEYQAATGQIRDMMRTIDVTNKLSDPGEKIAHYYSDLLGRLWAKLRIVLLISSGMAAVFVGVWIWNRQQRD